VKPEGGLRPASRTSKAGYELEKRHQQEMVRVHGLWQNACKEADHKEQELRVLREEAERAIAELRGDARRTEAALGKEWEKELEDARARHESDVATFEEAVASFEEEIRRYEQEAGAMRAKISDLGAALVAARDGQARAEAEVRVLRGEVEEALSTVEQTARSEALLEGETERLRAAQLFHQEQLHAAQLHAEGAERALREREAARKEAAQARAALSGASEELSWGREQVQAATARAQALEGELAVAQRATAAARETAARTQAALDAQRAGGARRAREPGGPEALLQEAAAEVEQLRADKARLLEALHGAAEFRAAAMALAGQQAEAGELHYLRADPAAARQLLQRFDKLADAPPSAAGAARAELQAWVPREVLATAREYREAHCPELHVRHLEALVALLNAAWQKLSGTLVSRAQAEAAAARRACRRELNQRAPMDVIALQLENKRLRARLADARPRFERVPACAESGKPGRNLLSPDGRRRARSADPASRERARGGGHGHAGASTGVGADGEKALAEEVARVSEENRRLRARLAELSLGLEGGSRGLTGSPGSMHGFLDELDAEPGWEAGQGIADGADAEEAQARALRAFERGMQEAWTPRNRHCYRRGAAWLGRHARAALDTLVEAVGAPLAQLRALPIAQLLIDEAARGGGHADGGAAALADALRVIPASVRACRERLRLLVDVATAGEPLPADRDHRRSPSGPRALKSEPSGPAPPRPDAPPPDARSRATRAAVSLSGSPAAQAGARDWTGGLSASRSPVAPDARASLDRSPAPPLSASRLLAPSPSGGMRIQPGPRAWAGGSSGPRAAPSPAGAVAWSDSALGAGRGAALAAARGSPEGEGEGPRAAGMHMQGLDSAALGLGGGAAGGAASSSSDDDALFG
jgi:hypothetical protein